MTRNLFSVLIAVLFLISTTAPLFAHHSFDSEYDRNKPISFTGTIAKVDWMNPHIYIYVDVKSEGGKTTRYSIEGGAPNALYRQGLRKEMIKIGEVVSVKGYLAKKEGANNVNGQMTTQDGRNILRAPNGAGAPATAAQN